jgi:HK97 family phage major capsid protein
VKKKVLLSIFEESVLPMLQQKHTDVALLQKSIDDEYWIYDEADDGAKTQVKFTVSKAAKAKTDDDDDEPKQSVKEMVKEAVAEALKAIKPEGKALQNKDAGKKFTIPAECKRHGQLQAFKNVDGAEYTADERAFRFGMWGLAARGNKTAQEWCDQYGLRLQEKKFDDQLMQKLHSEATNTSGGYLVPEEFGTDLILLREQYGVARRLCKNVPMSSDTRTDPRQIGGLTASFVGEDVAGTESTMVWDQVRLTAKDLMTIARVTNQVNADAVINFGDTLAYECAYASALKEDQCLLIGDATSTYGGITGVRQALTNKWTASTAGTITGITKASCTTTLASLALADFENAVGSLPVYAQRTGRAVWVCHSFFYYSVMLKAALAAGGNTQYEIASGNRAPRPMFLGFPVEFSQVLPTATAATTVFALLGDFSLGASFGDRQQNIISFSEHATINSVSVFERNEIAIRAVERFDINVHDVGDGTTPGPIVGVATG